MGKPWQDEDTLRELYHDKGLNHREIADELDCARRTITKWADKHGIETRPDTENPDRPWEDEDKLREEYIGDQKSQSQIAEEWDCDDTTIGRWLERHGIQKRTPSEAVSRGMLPDGAFERLSNREWLEEQYSEKNKSLTEIADSLGCTPFAVHNWMDKHGIDRRGAHAPSGESNGNWAGPELDRTCQRCGSDFRAQQATQVAKYCSWECYCEAKSENITGEDNPNWNGGYDGEYGHNWPEQREKALERDGHTCQRCGMTLEEHFDKWGCSLHVHHISNKNNFEDYEEMNALSNLVTLCSSCHKQLEGLPLDTRNHG